ncbi:MAG: 16S rRNA processing protein RimM [Pseudomonadales bacterium]|nr:16S rRNA processing protein RimM [Pseudomonadales bacterium]
MVVGRLKSVFGVRGWIKLESFTEPADNILSYSPWRLIPAAPDGKASGTSVQRQAVPLGIEPEAIEQRAKEFVVKLKGFDNREQAATLVGMLLEVPRQSLPEAGDGEYYWHQLEGLEVYCVAAAPEHKGQGQSEHIESEHIGCVDHLLATGANDVLVVRAKHNSNEILIPYLPGTVVREVDLQRGRILVSWQVDAEE